MSYFDESGDQGQLKGSATYTLGGLLVDDAKWADVFDAMLDLRRGLRDDYNILFRHEVKANSLIRGGGDLAGLDLSPRDRQDVWVRHFQALSAQHEAVRAYAVVIHKSKIRKWRNPREISWEYALQRLRHATEQEGTTAMIIHDEGDNLATRQLVRKARRLNTPGSAFGTGRLGNQPIRRIVDDAVPRDSSSSYFLQCADLIAYAAFRTVIPPGKGPVKVCPSTMWDHLGRAQWADANGLATGQLRRADKPGVIVWPK